MESRSQKFRCSFRTCFVKNREDGVYAYCTFNDTEQGKHAKQLVRNGDVRSLSIYANKLKQIGGDVVHGSIRELSLVLAGSNPGAYIDFVMAHGDEEEDGVQINYDESALVIYHSSDEEEEKIWIIKRSKIPKQQKKFSMNSPKNKKSCLYSDRNAYE